MGPCRRWGVLGKGTTNSSRSVSVYHETPYTSCKVKCTAVRFCVRVGNDWLWETNHVVETLTGRVVNDRVSLDITRRRRRHIAPQVAAGGV